MPFHSVSWLLLRIGFVVLPVVGAIVYPDTHLKPELGMLTLVPMAAAVALFIWLQLIGARPTTRLEHPFSLTLPFFPISIYPLRFWLLCAVVFMAAGAAKLSVSIYKYHLFTGWSVLLFTGIGMLAAVLGWMHWHDRRTVAASHHCQNP